MQIDCNEIEENVHDIWLIVMWILCIFIVLKLKKMFMKMLMYSMAVKKHSIVFPNVLYNLKG